jgi:hypothetical protein
LSAKNDDKVSTKRLQLSVLAFTLETSARSLCFVQKELGKYQPELKSFNNTLNEHFNAFSYLSVKSQSFQLVAFTVGSYSLKMLSRQTEDIAELQVLHSVEYSLP